MGKGTLRITEELLIGELLKLDIREYNVVGATLEDKTLVLTLEGDNIPQNGDEPVEIMPIYVEVAKSEKIFHRVHKLHEVRFSNQAAPVEETAEPVKVAKVITMGVIAGTEEAPEVEISNTVTETAPEGTPVITPDTTPETSSLGDADGENNPSDEAGPAPETTTATPEETEVTESQVQENSDAEEQVNTSTDEAHV